MKRSGGTGVLTRVGPFSNEAAARLGAEPDHSEVRLHGRIVLFLVRRTATGVVRHLLLQVTLPHKTEEDTGEYTTCHPG